MDPAPLPPNPPLIYNPLDQQRAVDQSQKKKDIYTSSTGEIFTKNFIAGFSHALGTIVIYLIFVSIMTFILARTLLPQLQPLMSSLTNTLDLLQNPGSLNQTIPANQVEQLLQQYQR